MKQIRKSDLRRFSRDHITVYHNLPDIQGFKIEDAYINWKARTKTGSVLSFVNYIDEKATGYEAFTPDQYAKLP